MPGLSQQFGRSPCRTTQCGYHNVGIKHDSYCKLISLVMRPSSLSFHPLANPKNLAIMRVTPLLPRSDPTPMLRQASTIAYYTLLEALRNRLMWLLGLVLVIGIGLSGFLSDLAVTEQKETQVALLAAFLRLTAVFLMVIFVVTSLVREANDKGLELVLALPLPRAGYVLGKLAGFALLAVLPALMFGGLLGMLVQTWDAALWTASLLGELWIVAAFSLLCVMTFQQVMTALSAAMGFYLLARSVTALQQYGQSR